VGVIKYKAPITGTDDKRVTLHGTKRGNSLPKTRRLKQDRRWNSQERAPRSAQHTAAAFAGRAAAALVRAALHRADKAREDLRYVLRGGRVSSGAITRSTHDGCISTDTHIHIYIEIYIHIYIYR
jgi:mevalonate pyrophosphate decarboxylase